MERVSPFLEFLDPIAIIYNFYGYPPFVLKKSLNPGSQDSFLYCSVYINIVRFGGFFTIGDTQKFKESLGHI